MRNTLIQTLLVALFIAGPSGIPSCESLLKTANEIVDVSSSSPLTESEIAEGLKTALLVGTDSSVSITSRLNGFYKDEAIRILLPPEASIIYENKDNPLFRAVGIDKKIDEAILAINRAAEDAAKEAAPIFKNTIRNITISEGLNILRGKNPAGPASEKFDSTAATGYLRATAGDEISRAFSPKINASLDKKLVGQYSPNQIWNSLTSSYNSVADKSLGMISPVETTDLGVYVTEKAVDGLFLKVAEEEIRIRRDPLAWASTAVGNIFKRVFGQEPS